MDPERLKQWMEIAKSFQGNDFWSSIFDNENPQNMMNQFADMTKGSQTNKPPQSLQKSSSSPFPRVDIFMSNYEVILIFELPGVKKGDLELAVSGRHLIIKGNVKSENQDIRAIHTERYYGPFERTIELPEPAEETNITAVFQEGLLEVTYPRIQREKNRIKIK
ncbi:Hsp20/alpha crystallin family protein [Pseudalkalibacillus caeni]|uniref:Hsp20/alpha crystallin family protein n=1 Tax=Exobacillus caeni TaxID=2574798 RepID=A0A5R9F7K5_9BACL|nr:Hsp20/alpha crystallin family protein [Pseudalkalibacillus caeni]TLS37608.1 Hsp20/alpha crystallin family protein [Pseudalkalibacillus caeni]